MTIATAWPYDSGPDDRMGLFADALPQKIFGGAALVCVAAICAWTICIKLDFNPSADMAAPRGDRLAFAAGRGDELSVVRLPALAAANIGGDAFDSRFSAAFSPDVFLGSQSFAADERATNPERPQLAAPIARNRHLAPPQGRRLVRRGRVAPPVRAAEQRSETVADAPPADESILERLFGRAPSAIFAKLFGPSPDKVTLAYAAPEAGNAGDGTNVATGLYDRQTAVYDISTHTVYMPDGTALEAHSGLGSRLDDPRFVAERDRGPTPPDVYNLEPRGALFHGVRALRLIPVDEKRVFGRSGLLAHSFMLGPDGDSNGCVSFRDYNAFLQAYENHKITRLAVVSRLD
jgi:hypothetical protein